MFYARDALQGGSEPRLPEVVAGPTGERATPRGGFLTIRLLGGPFHGMTRTFPDDQRMTRWEVSPTDWPTGKRVPKLVYVRAERPESYELPDGEIPFLWDRWLEAQPA